MLDELLCNPQHTLINLGPVGIFGQIINAEMVDEILLLVAACSKVLVWSAVDGAPITHDKAIKAHDVPELPGK